MSEEDSELERLKAKRLAEMQKNISTKEEIESTPATKKETVSETQAPKKLNLGQLQILAIFK